MIGYTITRQESVGVPEERLPPQVDITGSSTPVEVEVDHTRGVIYVHMEGVSVLRICQAFDISVIERK